MKKPASHMHIEELVSNRFKKKGLPQNPAVTFEDVTIVDLYSDIPSRSLIKDTRVHLARTIYLNTPIISANMDTITEHQMAIAMARLGGLGIIHQFMSIETRKREIELVKRADSGVIEKPLVVTPQATLKEAKEIMENYKKSGLLVIDGETEKLVGILSKRDWGPEEDDAKRVEEIMRSTELITAPTGVSQREARSILFQNKIEKLPLVDREGRVKGLMTAKDLKKATKFPNASRDSKGRLLVGAAVGVSGKVLEEIDELLRAEVDVILIDTARGNSKLMVDTIKKARREFKDIALIAGNVDTPQGTLKLIEAGADCVKVGIGPGSACTTNIGPGVGIPQLTAITQCYAVAQEYEIPIIGDGGIKNSDDLNKALVGGASCVMIGGLLAGAEETPGEIFYDKGEKWKRFRGSASLDAQWARLDRGELKGVVRAPEGEPKKVRYKGEVSLVIELLMGHLKSTMSYVGAWNLDEFRDKGRFQWRTRAAYEEGKPHDVD